jgi:hypothetical protein
MEVASNILGARGEAGKRLPAIRQGFWRIHPFVGFAGGPMAVEIPGCRTSAALDTLASRYGATSGFSFSANALRNLSTFGRMIPAQ